MKVFHCDHGITEAQFTHIQTQVEIAQHTPGVVFVQQVTVPDTLGTVPCGMYGPVMGDSDITDDQVVLQARGGREWCDRLIDAPTRAVSYVQAIGVVGDDGITLFTCYGGPEAPQHQDDPNCKDTEASKAFWSTHALVG